MQTSLNWCAPQSKEEGWLCSGLGGEHTLAREVPTGTCVESEGRARVRAEATNSRAGEGKPSSLLAETRSAVGDV